MAYRVAIPLHRFRCRKAFSTKWRNLYRCLSYFLWNFLFFLGGITAFIPCFSACLTITSLSYPRSANKYSAVRPSIKTPACVQSAVVPCVIATLIGIPCASTAKCNLVLSPLLCDSFPDFHLLHLLHVGEL